MTEYVHLVGAEQVQAAARQMQSAAEQMQRAASEIESSLFRHRQLMDDWLCRFEQVLAEHKR